MLLKSIELNNFRQYINEKIDFSTDQKRNITLVIGDTGAGKTTLEQAFRWVLYGQTEFNVTELINNKVKKEMKDSELRKVSVSLFVNLRNLDFVITREAEYKRKSATEFTQNKNFLTAKQIKSGNFRPLTDEQTINLVRMLIPKELSDYFFVDGEKIEKMSKQLKSGSSDDFGKVVKAVLGLDYIQNALRDLSNTKNGLQGIYNKEIDLVSGAKINSLSRDIENLNHKIQAKNDEIFNAKSQIGFYSNEVEKFDVLIRRIPNAEEKQKEYNEYNKRISQNNIDIQKSEELLTKNLGLQFAFYLASPAIKKAMNVLKDSSNIDLGIPDIQNSTIEHLLKKGKCICGVEISEHSEAFKNLVELQKYIPPQSLGNSINNFIRDSKSRIQLSSNLYDNLFNVYKGRRKLLREVSDFETKKSDIDEILNDIQDVLQNKKKFDNALINKKSFEIKLEKYNQELGALEKEKDLNLNERNKLVAITQSSNRKIVYNEYAKAIHNSLNKYLLKKEEKVRCILEEKVNGFLRDIYKEGMSIKIDKKYNIIVSVDEALKDDKIDSSTGQGYTIIFSFIASVIQMAKEKERINDSEEEDTVKEVYPLVMDAPLSTLNDGVIKNLCGVLPGVAEQVIIFVNDKDGKLVIDNVGSKIGKMYQLVTNGLLETRIEERK